MRQRLVAVVAVALASALVVVADGERSAHAEPPVERASAKTAAAVQPAWCAPEYDALTPEICHVGASEHEGRRTLVIFLHGAIAKDVTWQHTQERALARQAKQSKFEAIFPRAPLGSGGYLWPGTIAAQESVENELVSSWSRARRALETRNGKPFDDVFVMGFSSGAYFVASLALRGKLKVDGYAVFAGGAPVAAPAEEIARKPPVFVGVCAEDAQTAGHSRAFGAALAARGFPNRIEEQPIGHMFGDAHVAHAVAYLRGAHTK